MKDFTSVKEGDYVVRMLAGTIPMKLKVINVTDKLIQAGYNHTFMWEFDRVTGIEVDDLIPVQVSHLIWEN